MAAIDFPTATSNGQTFEADSGVIYTYVGTPPNGFWSGTFGTTGLTTLDGRYIAKNDSNTIQTIQTQGLKFNSGNADTILIDGLNSRIGIGTTSPDSPLTITKDAAVGITIRSADSNYSSLLFGVDTGSGFNFITSSNSGSGTVRPLAFRMGASEAVRIDSSGRVGIGTSAPNVQLHCTGDIKFGDAITLSRSISTGLVTFTDATAEPFTQGLAFRNNETAEAYRFQNGDGTSTYLTIRGSGNVGIGTTSIDASLHVKGAGTHGSFVLEAGGTSGSSNQIYIQGHNNAGTSLSEIHIEETAVNQGALVFKTNGGSVVERMRIDSAGNIKITFPDGNNGLRNKIAFTTESPYQDETAYIAANRTATSFAPTDLIFATGTTAGVSEKMRIDSGGNVGIGTSNPAAGASGGSNRVLNIQNGTVGGVCAITFGDSNATGKIESVNGNGSISINATSAVTIGTSGSSTERMRIDSSGRLLIGTSSSRGGAKTYGNTHAALLIEDAVDSHTNADLTMINNSASGYYPKLTLGLTLGSTLGSQGNVGATQNLGSIVFAGSDGTQLLEAGRIHCVTDTTTSTNNMPGRLAFAVTAYGAHEPTERMRINNQGRTEIFSSDGNVLGVGTATGNGTTNYALYVVYGRTAVFTGGVVSFGVFTNGNTVNTNNSYGAISDIKLKENIVDASSQWNDLKALQVRNYNFKEGQTHTQIGLIAQEVELVSPGLVSEQPDRDGEGNDLGTVTKSVNYSVLYMKAVKALQEAMERIETLELPNEKPITIKHTSSLLNNPFITFLNSNGDIAGSIIQNGVNSVSYATSSDYRLKDNVVELTAAIPRLKQLAPKRFNFIAAADITVDGFLAHEVQTVVPESVTGTHNEVDGDGNPVMQGIDQGKLVPLLTAALQEAIGRIETLEAKVATLEGS